MEIINEILVGDPNQKEVIINNKIYYPCAICGRLSYRKIKSNGLVFCQKHYNQFKKYGHAIDCNPRCKNDKNEIRIDKNIAYIDLYDVYGNKKTTAIVDADDVPKVRYSKWRISHGYVITDRKFTNQVDYLHRIILGTNQFVDHINHNTMDNRKSNLRIVTKSQNQMNCNYLGVSVTPSNEYYAHIKINGKMLNLGKYIIKEEAYYARWYAETFLFGEYQYNKKQMPLIPEQRQNEIKDYVNRKVQRL